VENSNPQDVCLALQESCPIIGFGDSQFRVSPSERKEVNKMTTGKKAASDAGKILSDPKSTKKEKEVAASDLAQRRKPKG
jgi:hypothetical protein